MTDDVVIKVLDTIESFTGIDGKIIPDLHKGEVVSIPTAQARVLEDRGVATIIQEPVKDIPKFKRASEVSIADPFDLPKATPLQALDMEIATRDASKYTGGTLLTKDTLELLQDHHQDTAIAKFLNRMVGSAAGERDTVRWCNTDQKWYVWDGSRWEPDERDTITGIAWNFIVNLQIEAVTNRQTEAQKKIWKSESDNGVESALNLLKTTVSITTAELDANLTVLNVLNGTIDLTTQELRSYNKAELNSKIAPVKYDPDATCPQWVAHLKLVFKDDAELISAFQRVVGYSLLGGNAENKFVIPYGAGKNGKTVSVNVITKILGEYAIASDPSTFYIKKYNEGPRPDIARMKGARIVASAEGTHGRRFDESLLKQLTGGDPVTARFLYGREFNFIPTATIWYHTNHLPKIRDRDLGIWRRPYPIPFEAQIPDDLVIKDYDKILVTEESSGILNWMLQGLGGYLKEGKLLYPLKIKKALAQYKRDTDALSDFFEWYLITGDEKDRVKRADMWSVYKHLICPDNEEPPIKKNFFNDLIIERIGPAKLFDGEYWYVGIRRKSDAEQQELLGDEE